ncbi:MAG: OmpA family protein [Nitrospiraceae bacterium]|nr:OmpA family protein [Nitrospiraceae bacterium]
MRKPSELVMAGMMGVVMLLGQGCATLFGSETGTDDRVQEEQIDEPAIMYVQPPNAFLPKSLSKPAVRAELSARTATGFGQETLSDVLFNFDESSIRADAFPLLDAAAMRLKRDGVSQVVLEGRGDEAGTAAYNIVLGDRRAKRVKLYLQELGLLSVKLKTTSYGKDRPLCDEHSRECWQRNRSVHFVVKESR